MTRRLDTNTFAGLLLACLLAACGGSSTPPNLGGSDGSGEEDADAASGDTTGAGDATADGEDASEGGQDAGEGGQDAETTAEDADAASEDADAGESSSDAADAQDAGADIGDEDTDTGGPTPETCDDGIPCTIGEYLLPNGGCGGGLFVCGDCAGATCATNGDCDPYEDDNPCNGRLRCNDERCVVDLTTIVTCSGQSGSPETVRRCNPMSGACEDMLLPPGAKCNDGSGCTARDRISGGACVGVEICIPCTGKSEGEPCDDSDPCTSDTTCIAGRCLGTFTCECSNNTDCSTADDGNLCNGTLRCVDNTCQPSLETLVHCNRACPQSSCFKGLCLENTGQCTGEKKANCAE